MADQENIPNQDQNPEQNEDQNQVERQPKRKDLFGMNIPDAWGPTHNDVFESFIEDLPKYKAEEIEELAGKDIIKLALEGLKLKNMMNN